MRRYFWIVLLAFIALAAAAAIIFVRRNGEEAVGGPRLAAQAAPADLSGFARAVEPRPFIFPADHGPHPEYQTEWWYYTGNLETADGRRFGYQFTFFRRALLPAAQLPERDSDWASGQVYMAHFALSDIDADRFHAFERLGRGAAGLAGAQAQPYRVWLEDWQAAETTADPAECPRPNAKPCGHHLQAARDGVAIDFTLLDTAGPALQGDQGLSYKGADPGQASYYYSLTRMATSGTVTVDGRTYEVTGWSWMDHEWSTSALSKDQVGWDWFSIQLDQGGQLMVFQIRREDGSAGTPDSSVGIDPFSSGLWVHPDGSTQFLERDDFDIQVLNTWESPHSGAVYPAEWMVNIPALDLRLQVRPHMADQELNVSYAYWEGAVRVWGMRKGGNVSGNGYVELTGYSGSMGGEF